MQGESTMIGKGLFHTHLVVSDLAKSLQFYTGLFGMQEMDFKDGTLVFLTTPGRDDLLVLNPGGDWGTREDARKRVRVRNISLACKAEWRISAICCPVWRNTNALSPR
jgi:catechol 2,3-dioxygenase-like lactoylglutathione lyase family enzyme